MFFFVSFFDDMICYLKVRCIGIYKVARNGRCRKGVIAPAKSLPAYLIPGEKNSVISTHVSAPWFGLGPFEAMASIRTMSIMPVAPHENVA